jgi:hypothetical protein
LGVAARSVWGGIAGARATCGGGVKARNLLHFGRPRGGASRNGASTLAWMPPMPDRGDRLTM